MLVELLLLFLMFIGNADNAFVEDVNDESVLDIAAFNVQIFGTKKFNNPEIRKYLIKIILRYDLLLLQEIRDSTNTSIHRLLSQLSSELLKTNSRASYRLALSPRLGRTNSKEEYAFIYRADLLSLVDTFTYNDVGDVFEREPFVARFKAPLFAVDDFAVVGIHTSPGKAQLEISNLLKVYDQVTRRWRLNDVIIMGDFNGGCDYVDDWSKVNLATDPRFYWIIDHSKDTTTKNSDCPYDRIVVSGRKMVENILPYSGGVFYFDEEFGISKKLVYCSRQLSVNLTLCPGKLIPLKYSRQILELKEEQKNNWFSESISIHDARINRNLRDRSSKVYELRKKAEKLAYNVNTFYKTTGAYSQISVSAISDSKENAFKAFDVLLTDFPEFISPNQVNIGKRFIKSLKKQDTLAHGHGRYKTLHDFYKSKKLRFKIKLDCNLEDRKRPECAVTIDMTII